MERGQYEAGRKVGTWTRFDARGNPVREASWGELGQEGLFRTYHPNTQLREEGAIRLVWHYVLSNQLRTSVRTPEQLDDLRAATALLIDRIRSEKEWAPKPGPLCNWCDYKEICPVFQKPEKAAVQTSQVEADEVVPVKEHRVPMAFEMHDMEQDTRTKARIESIEINEPIKDSVFSLSHLRSGR